MKTVRWLKERIYREARPLFRRYLDEELERLLALTVQYQRFDESDPDNRPTRYDHTLEPAAHLPLFGSLAAGEKAR